MNAGEPSPNTYELLTGPGPAAIASLAVRGPNARAFRDRHLRFVGGQRSEVRRATLLDDAGEPLDEIVVVDGGGDTLVLHLHGNPVLVRRCAALLDALRFRPRGFAVGDLWEGDELDREAAALAPSMLTRRGLAWLAAQPGRLRAAAAEIAGLADTAEAGRRVGAICERRRIVDWFVRPLRVAVVGSPNVGKSTLINALVDRPISITSAMPGTTRDYVEAVGEIDGFPVAWLDTAGLRDTADPLERAGIERTCRAARSADVVVLVAEWPARELEADAALCRRVCGCEPSCVVINKFDLADGPAAGLKPRHADIAPVVLASALQRTGLEELSAGVMDAGGRFASELAEPAAFADRHPAWLEELLRRA